MLEQVCSLWERQLPGALAPPVLSSPRET
jgi:hypothetical protein